MPQLTTAPALAFAGIQLSLGLALFILWTNAREYRVFVWLAGYLSLSALNNGHRFFAGPDATTLLPVLAVMLLHVICGALLVRTRWWLHAYTAMAVVMTAIQLPYGVAGRGEAFNRPFLLLNAAAIVFFSVRAIWRGPFDIRLAGAGLFIYVVTFAWFPLRLQAGPWLLNPVSVVSSALGFVLLALQLQRLAADRRERQRLAAELEGARLVQQLLLSEERIEQGHLLAEATYHPALEVGGDFYQLLPCSDGALLVLVVDVSGKGLRAAMLVALLTGAVRNRRSDEPAGILQDMNRVLLARHAGGFVTCLCARIQVDGAVQMANAGHLPPYHNGQEAETPSGLPLGLMDDDYQTTTLQLAPGDILTLLSDGVVEAANTDGLLLGFERTRDLSVKPPKEIAAAAQAWGQNDDITVVTVRSTR